MKQLQQPVNSAESSTEVLKLYEKEFEQMKAEIEELALQRNKYALENFNMELRLKEYATKFEDFKKLNDELEVELRTTKSKLNRAEFDLENSRLDVEKPLRENKQLKRDLDDLYVKLNELQIISENEISYRQQIEKKLKETLDLYSFREKLSKQEVETLKTQLESIQADSNELKKQLSNAILKEKNLEIENSALKNQLITTKQTCMNLQNKLKALEDIKERVKSNDVESLIEPMAQLNTSETKPNLNKVSFHENSPRIDALLNHQNKNLSDSVQSKQSSHQSTGGQVRFKSSALSKFAFESSNEAPVEGTNNFLVHSSGRSSPLFSSSSVGKRDDESVQPPFAPQQPPPSSEKPAADMNLKLYLNRDFTKELFNQLEKKIFTPPTGNSLNYRRSRSDLNSSVSSIDNHTVNEASYVGNVKIHEVNKNGYFVRLLNVSSTHEEDMSNYSIQQIVSTMPVAVYRLPQGTKLGPGNTLTVWARTEEVQQEPPHTFIWSEQARWGTGPECTTILAKPNGQAVSWTTGCHKYGNIALKDYDDLVPVYTHKRNKTNTFLDRNKLVPQTIYTPTKHPHGIASVKLNEEISELQTNTPPLQRNLPVVPSRPRSSYSSTTSNRSIMKSKLSITSNLVLGNQDMSSSSSGSATYKENCNYFQQPTNKSQQ